MPLMLIFRWKRWDRGLPPTIGARADKDYIRTSILDPNAVIAEGFERDLMPPDMGTLIYASELEVLVNFLADSR